MRLKGRECILIYWNGILLLLKVVTNDFKAHIYMVKMQDFIQIFGQWTKKLGKN